MAADLSFKSYSTWTREKDGHNFFDWCVFLDEGEELLNQIAWIEYRLHPTFPDPIRRVEDRTTCFAMMSSGWGDFTIRICVHFVDGREQSLSFQLSLKEDAWPRRDLDNEAEITREQLVVYQDLPDGTKRRWRKARTIAKSVEDTEANVLDAVAVLESKNLVRRAFYRALDGAELWGSTAIVGIRPLSTESRT
jgi:transcription initiation factor IIF auxiliary subunit